MGNEHWSLGIRLIFIVIYLVAYTYTCLGARNNITTVACSKKEMLALFKFKNSVKDKYDMLSSWVGIDCCRWERVQCDSGTGYVQGLYLRSGVSVDVFPTDFLVGIEVSNSLGELKHLKYLDLSGNDFQGSRIPEFIGSLKQLHYLNLSHSGFSGNIPHHIGNLSQLKVLDLSLKRNYENKLMADDMSWISGLSSLEYLDLSYVDLSGAKNHDMVLHIIPSLVKLSLSGCGLSNADLIPLLNSSTTLANIKHLNLGFNSFYGQVPYVFQNMTSLEFLDLSFFYFILERNSANLLSLIPSLLELHLSYCGLEGRIQSILTNMTSLQVLDLSGNKLNSSFPIMPNLLELDLSYNEFKEIDDVGIWRQCHLKQLTLKSNRFLMEFTDPPINMSKCSQYSLERLYLETSLIGTIPKSLGRMANLRVLHLWGNRLTGPIPASLERLRLLRVLDLSYNKLLMGPIPESLASLRLLETLALPSNQLIGPIPNFPRKLIMLDLSFNQLNGSIPESIGRLASLKYLNLQSNQLTGSLPESIGRLESLTSLFLGINLLTGPIPESVETLVSLQIFSVSSNSLNGTIPVSIGQLTNIRMLSISFNSLEGVVSEAHLANLSMLKYLDLGHNSNLTFDVSREWMPASQLISVELGSCKIVKGRFPQWLRNQRKLERLVLDNTTISGPLPTWLRKLAIIPMLSLIGNKLTGPLTNLPNGGTLNLYTNENKGILLNNNLFNGSIPRSLCRPDLEILVLGNNRLTGKIPNCLGNLQNLGYMVLSSNKLTGVIPSSLGSFSNLKWLVLNNNSFIGELPQELGNLESLEVLDLGENSFSGNVPVLIEEKIDNLRIFRLHKNNFTGRIPPSLCKHSNLQILDVAQNSLTGSIPSCLEELHGMVWSNKSEFSFFSWGIDEVFNGVVLEYTRTLRFLTNMDFSSNKLVGEIPVEIAALYALDGLNLSNNHLSGGIPNDIGNMRALISLDLSGNKLTGKIPLSITTLNFLSHLNLSHNNFSGQIPTGNQLQTLIDPSIYAGNKDLCGAPLPKNCSKDEDLTTHPKTTYKRADGSNKAWLYCLDILSGFATGFWGVIGVLVFKKQWRHKLFMFAESLSDMIYVAVMIRNAKMRRVT